MKPTLTNERRLYIKSELPVCSKNHNSYQVWNKDQKKNLKKECQIDTTVGWQSNNERQLPLSCRF